MCPVEPPPLSEIEPVTETLHGIPVTDPYRWIEGPNSQQTRNWIERQTRYARNYLDGLPGRERIRGRVRELLDVKTYDTFLKRGARYFFRKRLPGEEQPSIYFRDSADGEDQLLVDPAARGTGTYTAVRPLRVSSDGNLLLYEIKQGGERMGTFEILDVAQRKSLPESLPHGYLHGFAFAPDAKSFYYVHESPTGSKPLRHAAFHHVLGTGFEQDREIFYAGADVNLRLMLVSGTRQLGLVVYRFLEQTYTDFYVLGMGDTGPPIPVVRNADYRFAPRFAGARILAVTDKDAPNRRIVEVQPRKQPDPLLFTLVRESGAQILNWLITANHIVVSYFGSSSTQMDVFDSYGTRLGEIPCEQNQTNRLLTADPCGDEEVLFERESFMRPAEVYRYDVSSGAENLWAKRQGFSSITCACSRVTLRAKDGTQIPMSILGRRDLISGVPSPVIMTSYGGFGFSMIPQFSVLVTCLVESGCLFALPNIRGGSEFGAEWHNAAKHRNRQVAFDDFLSAATWLVDEARTTPSQLAIFGGSNSGLLVAAAMTQRPDLFRAVLCMVPITDMLRYHLFDSAHVWKDEFGTAQDSEDFAVLREYSPYHRIRDNVAYPATLLVSGDADQTCNSLHARKMTARLQAANRSAYPILLDYDAHRGHVPVLPLGKRIDALTDRLAFLSEQLQVAI
jgi:prolyl oligopeptidase